MWCANSCGFMFGLTGRCQMATHHRGRLLGQALVQLFDVLRRYHRYITPVWVYDLRGLLLLHQKETRNISIHLRQLIARRSHHWACVCHGLGTLQLHFHQGIIKLKWSNIQILIVLWILPMRTFKYKDYIIHLFITRENSFVAKTVGIKSTSRLCVASSM